MTLRPRYLAPLMAAGVAAAAIAMAPSASAADPPSCTNTGAATLCQKPGHARIHSTPPPTLRDSGVGMYGPFFWQNRGVGAMR
jgi:hypothetical protein